MKRLQKISSLPILAALLASGGAIAGYASLASAQSTDTNVGTSSNSRSMGPRGNTDPHKGGHIGKNGTREELLTGDSAAKATAAAIAAVPGGTVERVETDAEGATYEAHMTKTDGSRATVKLDANFTVTGTEGGFGKQQ